MNNFNLKEPYEKIDKNDQLLKNPEKEDFIQPNLRDPMVVDTKESAIRKKKCWEEIFLLAPEFADSLIDIYITGGIDAIKQVAKNLETYDTIRALVNGELELEIETSDQYEDSDWQD